MLEKPRVIAIDDKEEELHALIYALHRARIACVGIHFSGDMDHTGIARGPEARVVFIDLNLINSPPSPDMGRNFAIIGSILNDIAPKGPYLLVLWTNYQESAAGLSEYLNERLTDAAKPYKVLPLPKDGYIDPNGNSIKSWELAEQIRALINESPELAILTGWEETVLSAAAKTLSSITLLHNEAKNGTEQQRDIPRLITRIARESVGRENVEYNPFRALNEALLPILSDHISSSILEEIDRETWNQMISGQQNKTPISDNEAAQLNWIFHFAQDIGEDGGAERGAVIPLSRDLSGKRFSEIFGLSEKEAAEQQFHCTNIDEKNNHAIWVLIQTQPVCDYAQRKPGPLPFHLGIQTKYIARRRGTLPAAIWESPSFDLKGEITQLRVNARFQMPLAFPAAQRVAPLYRMREQLLTHLLHHIHSHGNRPGIISFRED